MTLLLLVLVGAAAGVLVGLVGIGGGVLYGPILLVALGAAGIDDPLLTPMTAGTSLLCVLLGSLSSAWSHWQRGAVDLRIAGMVGAFAAVPIVLTTVFVSTQRWYDSRAFGAVLGTVLAIVVVRLLLKRSAPDAPEGPPIRTPGRLAATGVGAGVLAALAGVGGGVVLVPALSGLIRLPFKQATATSSAAIVPIALAGVAVYIATGLGADVPAGALGYVDVPRALALAVPTVVTARWGVSLANRVDVQTVRLVFAVIAAFVSARLLWHAAGL